jgi:hypothetical protein
MRQFLLWLNPVTRTHDILKAIDAIGLPGQKIDFL